MMPVCKDDEGNLSMYGFPLVDGAEMTERPDRRLQRCVESRRGENMALSPVSVGNVASWAERGGVS